MKDTAFLAKYILQREEKKLDSVTAVDSGAVKGTGKTVFTVNVSKDLCFQVGFPWNITKLMLLNATTEKLINLVRTLPFGVPIDVDEAIFLAYKRDYNEDPVKKLVKFVNICRKFRKPVFLNVPSFWDLDKDIRNLCDFRATVIKRGIACIRGKYPNPEYEDLWLREGSKDIIDKEIGSDITDLNGVIRGINKCKNHLFDIYFPNLSEEEYSEYEKMSMAEEGKQLFLDEKRVYVMMKILTYILLEQSYFKNPMGTFSKWNSNLLTREINNQLHFSKYSLEFSKFRTTRELWRGYRKDWIQDLEMKDGVISAVNNNNNISNGVSVEEKASTAAAVSQPVVDVEEIA